ncbi:MAG: hypothetical protein LCH44_02135 [Bacteroidetes bacterium]|jgi:hypothetical protein|nr:hypothetical protein [Bacteroidota bacterium]
MKNQRDIIDRVRMVGLLFTLIPLKGKVLFSTHIWHKTNAESIYDS